MRTITDNTPQPSTATVVAGIICAPFVLAWSAFVLSLLWAWHIAPLGLPEISFAQAVGIDLVVTALTGSATTSSNTHRIRIMLGFDPDLAHWELMVAGLVNPLILLGMGYVAHLVL